MTELEKVIANLGYPVGMGMAPSPADLARMKSAIIGISHMREKIEKITGYDAIGNFLPGQAMVDAIDYLKADIALLETEMRATLEEVYQCVKPLLPDGWSDAGHVMNIIARALKDKP